MWGAWVFAVVVVVLAGVGLAVVEGRRGLDWVVGAPGAMPESGVAIVVGCLGMVVVLGGVVVWLAGDRR
jgi:hypothetical protein